MFVLWFTACTNYGRKGEQIFWTNSTKAWDYNVMKCHSLAFYVESNLVNATRLLLVKQERNAF